MPMLARIGLLSENYRANCKICILADMKRTDIDIPPVWKYS